MATIKEEAKAYEPKKSKNITDLEVVSIHQEIKTEVRKNMNDEEYKISFIVVNGEEYRVPLSVLDQLKKLIENKPNIEAFKVIKEGEGKNTKYQVIDL